MPHLDNLCLGLILSMSLSKTPSNVWRLFASQSDFCRFCASDPRNFDFVFSLVLQQVRSLGMLLIDGLLSVHADRCCFLQPSTMEILVESAFAHAPSRSFLKYFCGFSFKCDV